MNHCFRKVHVFLSNGIILSWILALGLGLPNLSLAQKTVRLYSYRAPNLIDHLLQKFEKKTGIKVEVLHAKKGLNERIIQEGKNVAADALLTVGAYKFHKLEKKRLLRKINTQSLYRIPKNLRSSRRYWTALTLRARVIYVSKRLPKNSIYSYEELAQPKWKNKICLRSGYHTYNLALFASILSAHGKKKTTKWLKGLKSNLARRPQGNDRAQARGIKEGICDLAIGNSYYYGKMLFNEDKPQQKEWGKSISLLFPNQDNRGTHVNISGIAILRYARNAEEAQQLVQFLLSEQSQRDYAQINYEFPIIFDKKKGYSSIVNHNIFPKNFKQDRQSLNRVVSRIPQVIQILDSLQFDS